MREFLSDHLTAMRDAFKGYVHGGKRFSSDEILGLVERFGELVAMAREQENEISRHRWNEAARQERQSGLSPRPAENVVIFPGIRRERIGTSADTTGDGGAA